MHMSKFYFPSRTSSLIHLLRLSSKKLQWTAVTVVGHTNVCDYCYISNTKFKFEKFSWRVQKVIPERWILEWQILDESKNIPRPDLLMRFLPMPFRKIDIFRILWNPKQVHRLSPAIIPILDHSAVFSTKPMFVVSYHISPTTGHTYSLLKIFLKSCKDSDSATYLAYIKRRWWLITVRTGMVAVQHEQLIHHHV